MKNFLIIGSIVFSQFVFAQTTQLNQAWSLTQNVPTIREITFLPDLDINSLLEEDEQAGKNAPYRFGFEHILNEDFFTQANRVSTENGDIYRQLFESPAH